MSSHLVILRLSSLMCDTKETFPVTFRLHARDAGSAGMRRFQMTSRNIIRRRAVVKKIIAYENDMTFPNHYRRVYLSDLIESQRWAINVMLCIFLVNVI